MWNTPVKDKIAEDNSPGAEGKNGKINIPAHALLHAPITIISKFMRLMSSVICL
jgi:hypothetical protein